MYFRIKILGAYLNLALRVSKAVSDTELRVLMAFLLNLRIYFEVNG